MSSIRWPSDVARTSSCSTRIRFNGVEVGRERLIDSRLDGGRRVLSAQSASADPTGRRSMRLELDERGGATLDIENDGRKSLELKPQKPELDYTSRIAEHALRLKSERKRSPTGSRTFVIEGEKRGVPYGGRLVLDADWKPVTLALETEFGVIQYQRIGDAADQPTAAMSR